MCCPLAPSSVGCNNHNFLEKNLQRGFVSEHYGAPEGALLRDQDRKILSTLYGTCVKLTTRAA